MNVCDYEIRVISKIFIEKSSNKNIHSYYSICDFYSAFQYRRWKCGVNLFSVWKLKDKVVPFLLPVVRVHILTSAFYITVEMKIKQDIDPIPHTLKR